MDDNGVMVFFAGKNDWLKKCLRIYLGVNHHFFPECFLKSFFGGNFLPPKLLLFFLSV